MSWLKLDDGFDEHPKLNACRDYDLALSTIVQLLCYAARNLTDGEIPARVIARMDAETVAELVRVGLLDRGEWGTYAIHDYLEYNPSREKVRADRAATAARVARHRNGTSNGVTGDVTDGVSTITPYPSLSLDPKPQDQKISPCRSKSTKVPDSVLGYWSDKAGREPSEADTRSLGVLCKQFSAGVVTTAIGQAVVQGEDVDNFGLITTIARAEA